MKKQRCYQDLSGKYQCAHIPVTYCLSHECDPLKGVKVLEVTK